ncbi:hypothetical protein SAMN05444851_1224 [Aliiroseovarius sediminilitoris]|uniref:Transposase n=1 Tax=Aliiroseovarius sediminilitoris TaxID=1173584 RepID=A0A1I0NZ83_9RHOB|nr:hypothetical protein SAMN05444851_1224 [Aliiroseovarius sediminilitoris]
MAGKKGQNKRFWSDEEKVSICAQTCAPGALVARVARQSIPLVFSAVSTLAT